MEEQEAYGAYRREKRTIDIARANAYGLRLLLPASLAFGLPFFVVWWDRYRPSALMDRLQALSVEELIFGPLMVAGVMLGGIVLHELIHGLTWAPFAPHGFRDIRFGVMWKYLAPYCHCKEPLRVRPYILGALMPALMLGVAPGVWSIAIGHLGMLLFGIFFTVAAIGDFMVVDLVRHEPPDTLVQDHPSEAGCYVFRKQ